MRFLALLLLALAWQPDAAQDAPSSALGLITHCDQNATLALRSDSQNADSLWPPARAGHAMAYDAPRGMVMVYGGDADALMWGWDGTHWHEAGGAMPNPGRRKHMKLVYDAARARLLMFGGATRAATLGDTWEWDGHQWARVATDGPAARAGYAMAYDPVRRHVVLFGGADSSGAAKSDTWEWDGSWTKVADDGPDARKFAEMAFDVASNQLVLVGGIPSGNGRIFRDAWGLSPNGWRKLQEQNMGRALGALSRDPASGDLLWIGGRSDSAANGDALRRTSTGWIAVPAAPIPERFTHDAALDTKRNRVVVFGGSGLGGDLADLWEWDGRRWTHIEGPAR
jgi:hypothetical protein